MVVLERENSVWPPAPNLYSCMFFLAGRKVLSNSVKGYNVMAEVYEDPLLLYVKFLTSHPVHE